MKTTSYIASLKRSGSAAFAIVSLLLAMQVAFPAAGLAAITQLVPNSAYFLATSSYNDAVLESISFSMVDFNDANPPTVGIAAPANGTASGMAAINVLVPATLSLSKVQFLVNGVPSGELQAAPFAFAWDTSTLAAGAYAVSVQAFDSSGNVLVSDQVTVSVAGDTIAPVVSLTAPTGGATLHGTVTVSAQASDNVGVTRVELYQNGLLQKTLVAAPYSFSWDTAALANGSYTLSARAYDAAGNLGHSSDAVVTVFNDSIAPVLTINPVVSPTSSSAQTLSGTVSDNDAVASVTVQVGSGAPSAASVSGAGWSLPISGLPAGTNQVSVRATDRSGNSATATASIVVTSPAVVAPPITLVDAQVALQLALTPTAPPSAEQLKRLDLAPFVNGKSVPNGVVDTGDVVVILLKLVGRL